jgi:hypothetical protein
MKFTWLAALGWSVVSSAFADEGMWLFNQPPREILRERYQFDATDAWLETKSEVQRVIDDGRKINQVVARGAYGTKVSRLWAALRTGLNDLARVYNVPPLGV